MPLVITDEEYNGLQGLYANAGDWVDAEINFVTRFAVGSGNSNKFTYNNIGGNYSLSLQSGSASDWGFVAGDTIVLTYNTYTPNSSQTFTTTVLYTTANKVYIADEFTNPSGGFHINGRQFPTDNFVSGLLVLATKSPASINMAMNLTPNGSALLGSVIDGELSQFELAVVTGIPTGVPQPMTQLISKSGSLIKDVDLTLISTSSDYWRNYRIRYKFFQWGIIKDGFTEPNYYDSGDCLAPIVKITAFAQYGNPNGINERTSDNTEGNTGGFDENFNGGVSLYQSTGITWEDDLGNSIQGLNYSGVSRFEATVQAPSQSSVNSTYRLGLVWRPIDGTFYQNIALTNIGENLLVVAPETDFIADGSTSPTTFLGYENSSGARWDLSEVTFVLSGTLLTISGKISPNGQATALFAGIPDGGRLSTLWVSIGDESLDGTQYSKRVSLKLFDEDNIDAPIIGVQIPNVIDEALIDHAGNIITTPLPQTTTEDDVLYRSHFSLIDGLEYEGIRTEIIAYNTVTEEEFSLENAFFSFNSVPFVGGQFQPNFIVPRGFNLPPTSDRNHLSVTREPSLDSAGKYALKLEYGYLSQWQYWLEQSNANNDFFDINEFAFDGLNRNWQRFSNSGDWIVRLAYYTRLDGVDDFNYQEVGIRPYEDDVDVTTNWGIELLSSNTFPTNLVADELHEITATLTWAIGAYTNPWAEVTIEDYEAGNRWVISSVLAQGGIANNPLQPIAGATQLDMTFPASNIAVLKTNVDTSLISSNKVCLSARIYSEDVPLPPEWEWLIEDEREAIFAYSDARRLASYYNGPLIRVRRDSDNAEQDIGYIQVGIEWVLDEVALLNFVGTGEGNIGYIVVRYNQCDAGNRDARQVAMSSQPPIVNQGVVLRDPITNRPAHLSNGVNHGFEIDNSGDIVRPEMLSYSVFADTDTSTNIRYRASIGNAISNQPHNMLFRVDTNQWIRSYYTFTPIIHFVNPSYVGGFFLMTWGDGNAPVLVQCRMNGIAGNSNTQSLYVSGRMLNTLDYGGNRFHQGYKSEDVVFGQQRAQSEIWIENNVNNFYQIF